MQALNKKNISNNSLVYFTDTAFILVLLILIINIFGNNIAINNGDYGRITTFMHIHIPSFDNNTKTIYNIEDLGFDNYPILSFLQLLSFYYRLLMENLNLDYVNINVIIYLLGSFFTIGLILNLVNKKYVSLVLILIPTSFYGFILNSLYEESVVLAFIPLLVWSLEENKFLLFIIFSAIILTAKVQMIFAFPLFIIALLLFRRDLKTKILYSAILFLFVCYTFNMRPNGSNNVNGYNRFYNGIGNILQDVETWPAKNFEERHGYFYKNKQNLQPGSDEVFVNKTVFLAGTSYYPTGDSIFSKNPVQYSFYNNYASGYNYIFTLLKHPIIVIKLVYAPFVCALKSEFSLNYIVNKNNVQTYFASTSKLFSKLFYVFFVLYFVMQIIANKNIKIRLIVVALILMFPTLVVVGDGFYEFEKHLIVFLVLMPFFDLMLKKMGARPIITYSRANSTTKIKKLKK